MELYSEGPELQMDSMGRHADVAIGGNGDSIIVWENPQPGGERIAAQQFASDGSPLLLEFDFIQGWAPNKDPAVVMDANGYATVIWMATDFAGMKTVVGQRFNTVGASQGPAFEVAPFPEDVNVLQYRPDVAMDADGNILVVWIRLGPTGSGKVYGRRYHSDGQPVGPEFLVASNLGDGLHDVAVVTNEIGNALVAWNVTGGPDADDIYAQRYDNTGTPLGSIFQVNTDSGSAHFHPAIAMDDSGNAVVVWDRIGDGDSSGIFGQRFDSTGSPIGPEFQVNTTISGAQKRPAVAMDDDSNFVVTWQSGGDQDGDKSGVFAQVYDAAGTPDGPEFQVNTYTNHNQNRPSVAIGEHGRALMVWQSQAQAKKFGYGVFGQGFVVNKVPVCDLAQAQPAYLYSNDHAFKFINIDNVSDPYGDVLTLTVDQIYQDEAVNAAGSGFTSPDGQGIGTNVAEVRDEHVISGNGRQYRIEFTAEDQWGAACSGAVYVRAISKAEVDGDWIIYDSTETPPLGGELLNPSPASTERPMAKVAP